MPELTENLLRLRSVPGVGNATVWNLIRHFGNADAVLGANVRDMTAIRGLTREKAELLRAAVSFDPRPEMERAVQAGIDIIPYDDPVYPKPLLHTFDPPLVLYVRGKLTEDDMISVGIVGTRQATPYGRDSALELSSLLSRGGYTIVSGLARGIDTFAHIGALKAGGRTVGVLGCGFDHMYPEENRDLALEMSRNGAVISEFPMSTPPSKETFPTRNRIIAGMSMGLLVIEAPVRSGSLITARLANEIGRTVFAIPGRVGDPGAEGCNKLIRDGAVIVMSVDDIFTDLNPQLLLPRLPNPKEFKKKKSEAEGKAGGKAGGKSEGKSAKPKAPERNAPERTAAERKVEEKTERKKDGGLFSSASGSEHTPVKPQPPEEPEPPPPFSGKPNPKLSEDQAKIFSLLDKEWRNADDICAASGLPPGKVVASLAMLKIMRLAEQSPGQMYRRK